MCHYQVNIWKTSMKKFTFSLNLQQRVIEKIWCCVHYQLLLNHFYCSYIVDPISDFLYVKRSANGSVIVDHINCHLAPSRFRGVHRKSKWVSWTSFASRVLIRNLNRKEKKSWVQCCKYSYAFLEKRKFRISPMWRAIILGFQEFQTLEIGNPN